MYVSVSGILLNCYMYHCSNLICREVIISMFYCVTKYGCSSCVVYLLICFSVSSALCSSVQSCSDVKYGRRVHVLPIDDTVEGLTG